MARCVVEKSAIEGFLLLAVARSANLEISGCMCECRDAVWSRLGFWSCSSIAIGRFCVANKLSLVHHHMCVCVYVHMPFFVTVIRVDAFFRELYVFVVDGRCMDGEALFWASAAMCSWTNGGHGVPVG